MAKKMTFEEFLISFRRSRKAIVNPEEMAKYSGDYNLDIEEDNLPIAIYTYGRTGHAWLLEDAKIGFWTVIMNSQPSSNLISDVEYELAKFYFGEDYDVEFFVPAMSAKAIEELKKVADILNDFKCAYGKLNEIWQSTSEIDVNDYLTTSYPFEQSFDEYSGGIMDWVESSLKKIATNTYQIRQ